MCILKKLLDRFREKFAKTNYSEVHVLKLLTYLENADEETMPHMLVSQLGKGQGVLCKRGSSPAVTQTNVRFYFAGSVPTNG
jgi:hypothetical protein